MKNILAAFAVNTVFANITLILILVGGGLSLNSILRETFPEFSVDKISIQIAYPGADPEEVEEGIVLKIEEALEGVEGVKEYTTTASENVGIAVIDVLEGSDVSEVLDDVKASIDAVSTFPVDAEKPIVTEVTLRHSVTMLSLSGRMSEKQLKLLAEQIKREIRTLNGISQVELFGLRDYEISIEVSEEQLRRYGITLEQVSEAIRSSSLNLHGGTIRTQGEEIRVRTAGRKYTGKELAEIVVLASPAGDLIRLGGLAVIRDGFTEDPISSEVDGEAAAFIMVFKTPEEDSIQIAATIKKYMAKKQAQLPPGVHLQEFYDGTKELRSRIRLLTKNGFMGLMVVFFLLWLFLDLRLSFWTGMGIPISLSGAIFILWCMGETLNMVSLFGFIMVLGIIVDDAIVVGESIYAHRSSGKPPLRAAVDGTAEVVMPVIAAVMTTIVAFVPLSFIGGIMGKFIAVLPVVVNVSLLVSLWESFFLLPAHLSNLPDLHQIKSGGSPLHLFQRGAQAGLKWAITRMYTPFLLIALRWRYILLALAICSLLLSAGLIQAGFVKFRVFPKLDSSFITAIVEFPEGTPAAVTRQGLDQLEQAFLKVAERHKTVDGKPIIEKRLKLAGQSLGVEQGKGAHIGSVQFILLPAEERGIHSNDLLIAWEQEAGNIAGSRTLTFSGERNGPGGSEVEVWLQGRTMEDLIAAAEQLQAKLHTFSGLMQIRSDFSPGKNEFRLSLKPEARALGLTVEDLARQVYAGFYGSEALRIQRGRDDVRAKVRYTQAERTNLDSFQEMRIRTAAGQEVPLLSVAEIAFGPGFSTITRTNGLRRIAVSADVDPKRANAQEVFRALSVGQELNDSPNFFQQVKEAFFPGSDNDSDFFQRMKTAWVSLYAEPKRGPSFFQQLEAQYPGLHISMQGVKRDMRESLSPLKISFPLTVLGIFVIVASIFRSYIQPFIILISIPFGIIGAILSHLLMGYDLVMMSLFGIVALSGVVVNDAIVLIERVNENLTEGMSLFRAIIKGGERRFRAIFLTSVSTVGGLAPLIMEKDMQAQFLIPMALSLAGGVIGSTILTLVLIPGLLVIVNDGRRVVAWLGTGTWMERETLEPGRLRR